MRLALFLFLASVVCAKPLTVCEVLQNRLKYDGQIVTVQGHTTGTMEGWWLDSSECPGVVQERDFAWDTIISVENAFTAAKIHAIDFEEDRASAFRVEQKYLSLRRRSPFYLWLRSRVPERCVEFVFTGQFGTRGEFRKIEYADGSFLYLGFGHGSQAPAQLVIRSTDDVVVRRGCR